MNDRLSTTDYGLIGHPLGHSQSKAFFTELFARENSTCSYDNFDLPELSPQALYTLLLLNPCLKGFNVTAPYKEAIIPFLDSISPEAERAGAVNTVVVERSDSGAVLALHGYNTDVEGFARSVAPMVERLQPGQGALVLGTGGASKAVVAALDKLGVKAICVSRAKKGADTIGYGDIDAALLAANPLVINATPAGTYPDVTGAPPFPANLLGPWCMVHDLVYNPAETRLMALAAERGAKTKNGLDMLHNQALASLEIWRKSEKPN